jgi:hypothetical protein
MSKKLEDMSFQELVDFAAIQIHTALLEGGGKAMKAALHLWMGQAILWSKYPKKEKK